MCVSNIRQLLALRKGHIEGISKVMVYSIEEAFLYSIPVISEQ